MTWERSDDVDEDDLDALRDAGVDVHTFDQRGGVASVDGQPLGGLQDVDVSVDADVDRVRDAVLERGKREYSFSVELDLDPTDPDDRETIRKLRRFFGGGQGAASPSRSRR